MATFSCDAQNGTSVVTRQDGIFVWTQTNNPPLLITFTDANNAISHVRLLTSSTLRRPRRIAEGNSGDTPQRQNLWSNGQVWDNLDFNALNAFFQMGTGYP